MAGHLGPKGQTAGAVLNYAGNNLDFLTPTLKPISNKALNPATYLNMDNGLEYNEVA